SPGRWASGSAETEPTRGRAAGEAIEAERAGRGTDDTPGFRTRKSRVIRLIAPERSGRLLSHFVAKTMSFWTNDRHVPPGRASAKRSAALVALAMSAVALGASPARAQQGFAIGR